MVSVIRITVAPSRIISRLDAPPAPLGAVSVC
jgi:hypothetical protein